jgi:hypothetical protein
MKCREEEEIARLQEALGDLAEATRKKRNKISHLKQHSRRERMNGQRLQEALQVLHDLFEAGSLDDHFYSVREHEGLGWEGPRMKRWGEAVNKAHELLKGYKCTSKSAKTSCST